MSGDLSDSSPAASWVELPENGWGALIGWAAGEENCRRFPASDAGRTVTVYTETAGRQQIEEEPFTAEDRHAIDTDIDAYLADAGLPRRPRGCRWMIRVPDGLTGGETLAAIDAAILKAAGDMVHPKQLRPVIAEVLQGFYGQGRGNAPGPG